MTESGLCAPDIHCFATREIYASHCRSVSKSAFSRKTRHAALNLVGSTASVERRLVFPDFTSTM